VVLNALAVQLMRESPRLVRALMSGQVLALGCTGARARRCGWGLAATAATLGALYVSKPSTVLALMLVAALVPGALLLGANRSELAELERRWLGWRLLPGKKPSTRTPKPLGLLPHQARGQQRPNRTRGLAAAGGGSASQPVGWFGADAAAVNRSPSRPLAISRASRSCRLTRRVAPHVVMLVGVLLPGSADS